MKPAGMKEPMVEATPRFKARIAVVFYLFTILMGVVVLLAGGRLGFVVDIVTTAFYIAVTVVFYVLTREPETIPGASAEADTAICEHGRY
jgi:Ca2+/Na+ antiporter